MGRGGILRFGNSTLFTPFSHPFVKLLLGRKLSHLILVSLANVFGPGRFDGKFFVTLLHKSTSKLRLSVLSLVVRNLGREIVYRRCRHGKLCEECEEWYSCGYGFVVLVFCLR